MHDIDKVIRTTSAFKILSDPTRFKILCLLLKEKDGMCVNEIADSVCVSNSAASHQLSKLESKGVVLSFREGQTICYELKHNSFTKNLISVIGIFKR